MPAPDASRELLPAWRIAAVSVGNALEFYDFLTFSLFAVYIAEAFFPGKDPTEKLYASLATFWAGFLTRPLGAMVLGPLGDRIGRRPAMLISFVLMGVGMLGLALTPPVQAIGAAAPALAVMFRLIQGFALGGNVGPTTAYLLEAAPSARRGFFAAFQYSSQGAASLGSALVGFALTRALGPEALAAWGWRIAFGVGVAIVPFGLWLRRRLPETLVHVEEGRTPPTAIRPHLRVIICGFVLLVSGTVVTYVTLYLTTFALDTLKLGPGVAFGAGAVASASLIIFSLVGGALSDRCGRRPVIVVSALAAAAAVWPMFWLIVRQPGWPTLFGGAAQLGAFASMAAAPVIVALTEGLPPAIRSGGVAMVYAFAISIFGGATQLVLAKAIHLSGDPLTPAWFLIAALALSLPAAWALRESAPGRTA